MNNDPTAAVIEVQKSFWQALQTKDRALFDQVLTDTYVCRWSDAPNEEREGFIQNLLAFPGEVITITAENAAVSLVGEVAVFSGIQSALFEFPNGSVTMDRIALTTVFIKKDSTWQMAFTHAVNIPGLTLENGT